MNPFAPLDGIIPAVARKYIYAIAAVLLLLYSLWQASQGNWEQFVVSLLSSMVPTLSAANTHTGSTDSYDPDEVAPENIVDAAPGDVQALGGPAVQVSPEEDTAAQASVVRSIDGGETWDQGGDQGGVPA